jgi:hypothetical protein
MRALHRVEARPACCPSGLDGERHDLFQAAAAP